MTIPNPLAPAHRSPKLYGLAWRGSIQEHAGRIVNVIDAVPLPLKPAAAASWTDSGLPVVIASSVDEAHTLCRELAGRKADELRADWEARGIKVQVLTPHQAELFSTAGEPAEASAR